MWQSSRHSASCGVDASLIHAYLLHFKLAMDEAPACKDHAAEKGYMVAKSQGVSYVMSRGA